MWWCGGGGGGGCGWGCVLACMFTCVRARARACCRACVRTCVGARAHRLCVFMVVFMLRKCMCARARASVPVDGTVGQRASGRWHTCVAADECGASCSAGLVCCPNSRPSCIASTAWSASHPSPSTFDWKSQKDLKKKVTAANSAVKDGGGIKMNRCWDSSAGDGIARHGPRRRADGDEADVPSAVADEPCLVDEGFAESPGAIIINVYS